MLIIIADPDAVELHGERVLESWAKNAGLFAMNLMNAGRGLGLETHPMDGFDEAAIKKQFAIPEDKIIPMLVAIGHLKRGITLLPRAFRRDIDEFTSFDSYQ